MTTHTSSRRYGEHPNVDLDINAILPQQHGHTLLSLAGHGSFYGAMEIFLDHGANPTDQTMLRCARMGDVGGVVVHSSIRGQFKLRLCLAIVTQTAHE